MLEVNQPDILPLDGGGKGKNVSAVNVPPLSYVAELYFSET